MATHSYHVFILAIELQPDQSDQVAIGLEEGILNYAKDLGLSPAPCQWAPDSDTVADGLGAPYDQVQIHDLNPTNP